MAAEHERGAWSRRTRHDYAQRLRAFFLFAEMRGWCRAGLAAGIVAPRFMADEGVPKGLPREDVVRLLASVTGDRAIDKRDRAILMLFIAYGLRTGEVGGLRLDDLDWENAMLRVRCPKPGRTHLWPLSQGVGHAILRYVREARPSGFGRSLFLTTRAPIRPLDRKALGGIVRGRLAGIGVRHRATRGSRPAACRSPASAGSGHVDEGDRRLPRAPRSDLHHHLRQGRPRKRFAKWRLSTWRAWYEPARGDRTLCALATGSRREVHGRRELVARLSSPCRWRLRLRRDHRRTSTGVSRGRRRVEALLREQILCACRLLAPCDQPRPCVPLADAGRSAEIGRPGAALHLLARRTSAPVRPRDRASEPAQSGPAGRGDVPDAAPPLVRRGASLRGGDPPHPCRRRSGERRPDHPGHQVL